MRIALFAASIAVAVSMFASPAFGQRCDIPREARGVWRCENGFVIGPENVIVRLPIPEADPEALYNAGIEAAQRQDWRVAIAYFTAAHQRAHLVPRYMYNVGLAHARAGNDVAAIAWFAAYLTAAPDAPNREAVWAQVRESETSAQRRIGIVRSRALEAAGVLPGLAVDPDNQGCWFAYGRIAHSVARSGDIDAATAVLRQAFACGPRPAATFPVSEADEIQRSVWSFYDAAASAAISDLDFATARRFIAQLPQNWDNGGQRLRESVERESRVAARERGVSEFWYNHGYSTVIQRLRATSAPVSSGSLLTALNQIPPRSEFSNEGFVGHEREQTAANIGVSALLLGDIRLARTALTRSIEFSRQYAELKRREYNESCSSCGWAVAYLDSALLTEREASADAVSKLEVFVSRQEYGSASASANWWLQSRFYAVNGVASFLAARGRLDDALVLAERLDSWRRIQFLERLSPRLPDGAARVQQARLAAGGGEVIAEDRRRAIENALAVAYNLGGAAYGLDEVLQRISVRTRSNEQILGLAGAQEELARGMRRARAEYERGGRVWGQ